MCTFYVTSCVSFVITCAYLVCFSFPQMLESLEPFDILHEKRETDNIVNLKNDVGSHSCNRFYDLEWVIKTRNIFMALKKSTCFV